MDEIKFLRPKLTRLKLSGMLETLSHRMDQAISERWSYSQFLDILLTDEVERRDQKQLSRRLVRSELDPEQTLETFDFLFNPRIHKNVFKELALCGFMEKRENLFLLGPTGVGKSHLAQALGHEACRKGHEVIFRHIGKLVQWIRAGKGDGSYERRLNYACSIDLLILDDFGLQPLSEEQQSDLFEIISERYGKKSLIITSNRDFNEWPAVFKNPLMGSAAMDRLVHRATKVAIEGPSFRTDAFKKRTKELTKDQEESKLN